MRGGGISIQDHTTAFILIADALAPEKPIDYACSGAIWTTASDISAADASLLVRFRPSFTWRHTVRCQRFVRQENLNAGQAAEWFRQPDVQECAAIASKTEARHMEFLRRTGQQPQD
jgi:hypothetical protein